MADREVKRRLAAILAADVAGYTAAMEEDTDGTVAAWQDAREDVIKPKVAEYSGKIVKLTGDGFLVEFPTVQDAVNCAIAMQHGLVSSSLNFRMGINLGDIVDDGEDIHGEGVNVAARLEGLAEPGGICISGDVYNQVRNRIDANYEDRGEQEVKNVSAPVKVFAIRLQEPTGVSASAAQTVADKPSIAVLPFDNLSGDPEQEYFSDGMAEDLITDLSKISNLYVAARNSSFSFKGQMPDVREVAEKLGVAYVLEGSVRKMGERLRINAQLIDAADGDHLWAERYDGNMDEIFDFQDRIRAEIVSALELKLSPTDKALAMRKPTDSVEAYDLFLKGRASYHRYTPEYLLEARDYLEKAIEIDADFAGAHGWLSYCHFQGWATLRPGFDDNLDRAIELAERGVALDGASAIALTRLGWIQNFLHRYDSAISNLEKAIALAPDNADVNATFGQVLNYWGDPERGLQMQKKAFSIEMIVPPNWEYQMGLSHLLLGQYDEAIARFNRAVEPPYPFFHAYNFLAWTYLELDQPDDANGAIKALLEIMPDYTITLAAKIYVFRIDEVRDRLFDSLRKAGLPE